MEIFLTKDSWNYVLDLFHKKSKYKSVILRIFRRFNWFQSFLLIRASRLRDMKLGWNKEWGKEIRIKRNRQSAECGGNQDVRYQERSEMTLDYTKLFRWQETSSQGSFHVHRHMPLAGLVSNTPGFCPVRSRGCCQHTLASGWGRFLFYGKWITMAIGEGFYTVFKLNHFSSIWKTPPIGAVDFMIFLGKTSTLRLKVFHWIYQH